MGVRRFRPVNFRRPHVQALVMRLNNSFKSKRSHMRSIVYASMLTLLTQPIPCFSEDGPSNFESGSTQSEKSSPEFRECVSSAWRERYPDLTSKPMPHGWRVIAYDTAKRPVADAEFYSKGGSSLARFRLYGKSIRWARDRIEACR